VVELPVIAAAGFASVLGAIVGSFAATAALRLQTGVSPWSGRSRCDGCARVLSWTETLPFAGYIAARGRCGSCGHSIHAFHLVGEGLGACVAACAVLFLPFPVNIVLALLGVVLLVQALIDVRTLRLPDVGNLIVAILSGLLALFRGAWFEGLIAALVSGAVLLAIKAWLERRHAKPMLGLGDVKLIAALALGLGQWTAAAVAVASILALAVLLAQRKGPGAKLPFGPAIALSGFTVLFGLTAGVGG
jgi:leader peptidase (prepilin peptidase) / N-methyltransferase